MTAILLGLVVREGASSGDRYRPRLPILLAFLGGAAAASLLVIGSRMLLDRTPSNHPARDPFGADGKPGWSSGFTGCEPARFPESDTPPHPGLSIRLLLTKDTYVAGEEIKGQLEVVNESEVSVEFGHRSSLYTDDGTLVKSAPSEAVSARMWTDVMNGGKTFELSPGDSDQLPVTIQTVACADTSVKVLPAGNYEALAGFHWGTRVGNADWYAPKQPVRLLHSHAP